MENSHPDKKIAMVESEVDGVNSHGRCVKLLAQLDDSTLMIACSSFKENAQTLS